MRVSDPLRPPWAVEPEPLVKNTIAVASGKGSIGKSTSNLAIALERRGARVGPGHDIYGPSIPILMGGHEQPHVVEGKIEPPLAYGVELISMHISCRLRVRPSSGAAPMLHKTIQQFLRNVRWGELDYLIMNCTRRERNPVEPVANYPADRRCDSFDPQVLVMLVASKAITKLREAECPCARNY